MADESELKFIATGEDAGAGSLFDNLSGSLGSVATVAGGVALAGVTAIGGALIGAGAAAVSFASQANQAVNDFEAKLGASRDEAEALGDLATTIFANNWGNSLEDVSAAVADVEQQFAGLGGIADSETEKITAGAFALRDSFGGETTDYISAARTLIEQFGLSGREAMDFITSGMQGGLNASGDFLDTIGEYSTQFSNAGADAGQFFSTLETGLGSGVLGTDKAADLFKEFTLRIADGSTTTKEALKGIGINAAEMEKQLASGQLSKADVFQTIIEKLGGMDDAVARDQIGVALLGTQYEDLGLGAALNIDLANTSIEDLAGSTDSLNAKYQNFGSFFTGIWRQVQVALLPVGEQLLSIANTYAPQIQSAISALIPVLGAVAVVIANGIGQAIAWLTTTGIPALISTWNTIQPAFAAAGAAIQQAIGVIVPIVQGLITAALPLVQTFVASMQARWQALVAGVQQVLPPLQTIVLSVFGIIAGFLQNHGASILQTIQTAWTGIQGIITALIPPIATIVSTIFGAIAAFLQSHGPQIQAFLGNAWQSIRAIILTAIHIIQATVVPAFQAIAGFIAAHGPQIHGLLSGAWTAISNIIQGALTLIKGVLQAALALIQGNWRGAWEIIKSTLGSVWDSIKAALSGAVEFLKNALRIGLDALVSIVRGVGSRLMSAGQAIVDMLKQGISSRIEGLKEYFRGKLQELRNMLPFSEPKDPSSPLRGLVKTGSTIVSMIQEGIDSGSLDLKPEKVKVIDTFLGVVKQAGETFKSASAGFGALDDFVVPARETLQAAVGALADSVADFWHGAQTVLYALKDDTAGKFADLASKATSAIGAAIGHLAKVNGYEGVARDRLQALVGDVRDAVADFWHAAQTVLYALEDDTAAQFADLAGKAASALGAAVGAFVKVNEYEGLAGDKLNALVADMGAAVWEFWTEAQDTLDALIDDIVPRFADAVQKAVGAIGAAVDAFTKLRDYDGVAEERLVALAHDMSAAMALMVELTAQANLDGVETAAAFATALKSVFDLFKTGVDALNAIREYQMVPRERMIAVLADFDAALRLMLQVTQGADVAGTTIAANFAKAAKFIFDLFKAGVDALDALRTYEAVPPERFAAFEIDFGLAIATMARIAAASVGMLTDAETWRDRVRAVADAIKAGISAIASLDGLNVNIDATVNAAAGTESADVPAFATGVRNFAGGLALVGEQGPELISLPRGTDVYTNDDTRDLLSSRSGTTLVINVDARGSNDERAVEAAVERGIVSGLAAAGVEVDETRRMGGFQWRT